MNKKADTEMLNKWLVRISKSALVVMATGLISAGVGIFNDVKDLQAKDLVHEVRIKSVEVEEASTSKKVDDLHWYLIRSKNVKVEKE